MKCKYCCQKCVKRGFNNSVQRFYCKSCNRYQQKKYRYTFCTREHIPLVVELNNEGVGISGIARIIGVSKGTVINILKRIAASIVQPEINETNQSYEIDELYTYVKSKQNPCYITYAINRKSRKIIDFTIGSRTSEVINRVVRSVKQLNPKTIFTDRLNVYPNLVKPIKHITNSYKINRIERMNLNLRTHLKRLSRKTICFSKSKTMLENCLRIYFYSGKNV